MNKKLRIWGLSNQDTAVFLYRILQPLQGMARQRIANVHHLPIFGQHAQYLTSGEFREYQALEGKWADVLFTTLGTSREYLALILALRDRYGLKLVVDLDDDILATHLEPNNPAYGAYTSSEGRHAEIAQYCIGQADLLTVSTPYLREKYSPMAKRIAVVPNCIDPRLFSGKVPEDPVTIGYAGSGSHQKDWEMVEPILSRMKKRHGVKVKVLGPISTRIADSQETWVDTLKYPAALRDMGISIGIAPLRDSAMARGKSNLRWLEYSALGIPTVASDTVPFRGLGNVTLVSEPEEWEAELERLILDPGLRTTRGQAAYNEVRENYNLSTHARELYRAISDITGPDAG